MRARLFFHDRPLIEVIRVVEAERPHQDTLSALAVGVFFDGVIAHTASGELFTNLATGEEYKLQPLGDVAAIVDAGGLFEFARETGMLKK